MCQAIWYTGPECAHNGYKADGTPIPSDKKSFLAHGEVNIETDRCAKYAKNRVHCRVQTPKYEDLVVDMTNYPYQLVEATPRFDENGNVRGMDYRCNKYKGRRVGYAGNYGVRSRI
jgi:hypothetical protein